MVEGRGGKFGLRDVDELVGTRAGVMLGEDAVAEESLMVGGGASPHRGNEIEHSHVR